MTISFYGGMTYWSINDPQLKVDSKGNGKLTATATGYGADMDKLDKWEKLTPQTVTMAEFSGVDVSKAKSDGGFTATPKFKGVRISDKGGRNPQDRSVAGWGSFPQSWIDFNIKTGQSSYWYTSGGQRDYAKPALPLTVALKAGYTPGESDYDGQSDNGAAQNPNQGSGQAGSQGGNQNPNAAANPGSNGGNGSANKADAPNGADDDSAFAPAAAEARAQDSSSPLTPGQWAGAGAIGAGALALTGGTGWFLRRRIGLDPTTWT